MLIDSSYSKNPCSRTIECWLNNLIIQTEINNTMVISEFHYWVISWAAEQSICDFICLISKSLNIQSAPLFSSAALFRPYWQFVSNSLVKLKRLFMSLEEVGIPGQQSMTISVISSCCTETQYLYSLSLKLSVKYMGAWKFWDTLYQGKNNFSANQNITYQTLT